MSHRSKLLFVQTALSFHNLFLNFILTACLAFSVLNYNIIYINIKRNETTFLGENIHMKVAIRDNAKYKHNNLNKTTRISSMTSLSILIKNKHNKKWRNTTSTATRLDFFLQLYFSILLIVVFVNLTPTTNAFTTQTTFTKIPYYSNHQRYYLHAYNHMATYQKERQHYVQQMCLSTNADNAPRDMDSLKEWAFFRGVHFTPGLRFERGDNNDWGVVVHQPLKAGTIVLSVPSDLVISSSDVTSKKILPPKAVKFAKNLLSQHPQHPMDYYLPEFLLMIVLLVEVEKGTSSAWYTWIRSLPTAFDTGLYMDDVERSYLNVMANEFIINQDQQWKAFRSTAIRLKQEFPSLLESLTFLQQEQPSSLFVTANDDKDEHSHLKWAFSIVFTRSWRHFTQTAKTTTNSKGKEQEVVTANIVPLGDMFNHDSQHNNILVNHPETTPEQGKSEMNSGDNSTTKKISAVQFVLQQDITNNSQNNDLYLSYGITQCPARFLVIFGFCDESCPEIYANVTFEDIIAGNEIKQPIDMKIKDIGFTDPTKQVFRTMDGAISQTVWNAVLYKILLLANNTEEANVFYQACVENNLKVMVSLYDKWEKEAIEALHIHVDDMITKYKFLLTTMSQEDSEVHRLLPHISKHCTWMIGTLEKVKSQVYLGM